MRVLGGFLMAGVLFGFVACKTESDATVEVEKVEITSTVTSVTVGEKITLTAKASPDNATDPKVTWSTSTAEIATVDESGVVTGVKAGNATITAKAGDKTATVEITVNAKKIETSTDNNPASDGSASDSSGTGDKTGSEGTGSGEDFVKVAGAEVKGATYTNNYTGVFPEGRTVTLSDFYMGKYEVTQAEYKAVMQNQKVTVDGTEYTLEAEPSYCTEANKSTYGVDFGTDYGKRPVEGVTWYDAVYYCNARSKAEKLTEAYNITVTKVESKHITGATVTLVDKANGYRLPTEAEWEYAARGGDQTADDWNYTFSGADTASGTSYRSSSNSGLDAVGWYCYNNKTGATTTTAQAGSSDGEGTHEVGKKAANRLGLYDMSGNVWEWCYDWYDSTSSETVTDPVGPTSGSCRVYRGGSWYNLAYYCTVFLRSSYDPNLRFNIYGFRVVRSAQ